MARITRFGTLILTLVVLTTGALLKMSHAQEPQSQAQPEEALGQVQERAVPAPPSLQPGTPFTSRSSPPPPTTATATDWANWLNGYRAELSRRSRSRARHISNLDIPSLSQSDNLEYESYQGRASHPPVNTRLRREAEGWC